MPSLNTTILSSVPIQITDLGTQLKISAVLAALDDKIELNRRTNETLEGMAQAIFRDGTAVATCRATLVMMDLVSRRSRPLTPEAIARLEPWRYRGA